MKTPVPSNTTPDNNTQVPVEPGLQDEGSDNMTLQVIERYAKQNKHIRWLSEWTNGNRQT